MTLTETTKAPRRITYQFTDESVNEANKIGWSPNKAAHLFGMQHGEALTMMVDSLVKYEAAYRVRYEAPLSSDYVLGVYWLDAVKAVKGLLDGNGAVAMERSLGNDSFDAGALCGLLGNAAERAGFEW